MAFRMNHLKWLEHRTWVQWRFWVSYQWERWWNKLRTLSYLMLENHQRQRGIHGRLHWEGQCDINLKGWTLFEFRVGWIGWWGQYLRVHQGWSCLHRTSKQHLHRHLHWCSKTFLTHINKEAKCWWTKGTSWTMQPSMIFRYSHWSLYGFGFFFGGPWWAFEWKWGERVKKQKWKGLKHLKTVTKGVEKAISCTVKESEAFKRYCPNTVDNGSSTVTFKGTTNNSKRLGRSYGQLERSRSPHGRPWWHCGHPWYPWNQNLFDKKVNKFQ